MNFIINHHTAVYFSPYCGLVEGQTVNGRGHQSNGLDELTTVLTFIDSRLTKHIKSSYNTK